PVQQLISSSSLTEVGKAHNYNDLESLFAAVGEHHLSPRSIAQQLSRDLSDGDADEKIPTRVHQRRRPVARKQASVHVEGLDDVLVRLAKCCTPVPGDDIMGFITRGRGVSVHRTDCANGVSLSGGQSDRLIDVEWDAEGGGAFTASVRVQALDRAGLLSDVTQVLAEHHVNILSSSTSTGTDRVSTMKFEFELGDPSHLEALIPALRHIDSVYDVYRILPGGGSGSGGSQRR
ncbi:MAG: ACT domain-containing protein, partial [Acidimicrobiales bacterium]